MTFEQARREGLDVFTFANREQRMQWAVNQTTRTVEFDVMMCGKFTLFCLAVAPRMRTTSHGNREFFNQLVSHIDQRDSKC